MSEDNTNPQAESQTALSDAAALPNGNEFSGMGALMDIAVTVSIEVGNTQMRLKDLLDLGKGSVVELNKLAGEPLDVVANGALIAHGEVVVVNEKYGIRITEVASQSARMQGVSE